MKHNLRSVLVGCRVSRMRSVLAAVAAGVVTSLFGSQACAEVVAQEDLFGHPVRIERVRDGGLSLIVPGAPPVALASDGDVRIERVTLGSGAVLVVRVDGNPPAVAVVSGSPAESPSLLFHGARVPRGEDVGERAMSEVIVRDLDGDGARDVVLAERRENVRLCSVGCPLVHARAVVPRTLRFAPVVLNPLRDDLLERPLPVARAVHTVPVTDDGRSVISPLSMVSSVSLGIAVDVPAALTDGRGDTVWRVHHRDFVTFNVNLAGFAVERIVLTAPPAPYVLPRSFTLLFEPSGERLDVTVPSGLVVHPGARVAVPIVPARTLGCLSLVVTDSSLQGTGAIADVEVVSALDRDPDPLATLVRGLDGPHGDAVVSLLSGLGARAVDAVALALPSLGEQGAHRAVRFLATVRTPRAADALVGALGRGDVGEEARLALQRFGAAGLDALARVVATDVRAADLILVARAPLDARLRAMAAGLTAQTAVWRSIRGAMVALVAEAARAGAFQTWLELLPTEIGPAARALSVAAEASSDPMHRALVASRARTLVASRFEDRYRLLLPLAGDSEGRDRVASVALTDRDPDLRAEAVRALSVSGGAHDTLIRALSDPVPRVRVEAARGLRGYGPARAVLQERLLHDAWPSVRAAAAMALAGEAAHATVLLSALDDPSVVVVRAVIAALERTPGAAVGPGLMAFAEDPARDAGLRVEALGALASRCERGLLDRLLALFERQSDPVLPPSERAVAHAALAALAHIDPARARRELRRLEADARGVAALERAMRDACPAR